MPIYWKELKELLKELKKLKVSKMVMVNSQILGPGVEHTRQWQELNISL